MNKRQDNWMAHYYELKEYVMVHHHFPGKTRKQYSKLLNWVKYNRKRINAGTMPEPQRQLFEELAASRQNEKMPPTIVSGI